MKLKAPKQKPYILSPEDMDSLQTILDGLWERGITWKADLPKRSTEIYALMLNRVIIGVASRAAPRGLKERQTKPYTATWHLTLRVQLFGEKQLKKMIAEIASIYEYKPTALRTYYSGSWGRVASNELKRIVGGAQGEERRKILASELKFLEDKES